MEIFKPIPGFENYSASNLGNIKTHNWKNTGKEAILKPATDKKGYLRVALVKNTKLITCKVHRLVALTFIPNLENKPQINHKNAIKSDNCVLNLEWVTNKENSLHQRSLGIQKSTKGIKRGNLPWMKGSNNVNSILTESKVKEIRQKFIPRKYTREMLAKEYNVEPCTIKDIILRKSWKHI